MKNKRHEKARLALRMVTLNLPHLTRLAQAVQLRIDSRVETAAVTPSGRVLFNPKFLDSLTLDEATFVTAHELYHLVLQTHQRGEESDGLLVNIAHDLIINDILENELRMTPPAGALRCRGARHVSMERLLTGLREKQKNNRLPDKLWRTGTAGPAPQNEMERALDDAVAAAETAAEELASEPPLVGGLGPAPSRAPDPSQKTEGGRPRRDALTRGQELELFPLDDPEELGRRTTWLLDVCVQSVALSSLQHGWERQADASRSSSDSERATTEVQVLQQAYRTPWERVVQQWLDAHIPQPRSYARPSRRAGDRTDVVLPGRRRDSTIIHVVLDTSGSMWPQLPAALGALAACCEAVGVDQVRIIQSDSDITVDEVVPIDDLRRYRVTGFSGWEGYFVRDKLKPPPPPEPEPEPQPEPVPKPQRDFTLDSLFEEPPRRRNKVVSKRAAKLSVPVYHRKPYRQKFRRGDHIKVRIRNRASPSEPQQLNLSVSDESPELSLRVEPDSNLAPAMRRLAEDPGVESALILTDGEIEYPVEPMPYDVLWVLVPNDDGGWTEFEPDDGAVVRLES